MAGESTVAGRHRLSATEQFGGKYHSFLVRLWQSHADGAWHATAQSIQSGEIQHFASIDELFTFLDLQANAKPDQETHSTTATDVRKQAQ